MTRVPGKVQRAAARLADSDQDVYHARVRLGPAANERDRRALVTGLEDSQTALELLDTDTDGADVLEFVTAPRFGIETVTDAIERCSFVHEVTDRRLLATGGNDDGEYGPPEHADEGYRSPNDGDAAPSDGGDPSPSSPERGEPAGPFAFPDDEVSLSEVIEQAHEASADDTGEARDDGAEGEAAERSSRRSDDADPEAEARGADSPASAIDARVARLESRFAQFDAYVDELEVLLDRQAAHQRRVDRIRAALDDLEASVAGLDEDSARHRRKLTAVRDAVEAATRERDDLADALHDLQERQRHIEDDVGALSSWRRRVSEAMRATTE